VSEPRLSPATKALLRAAREDGPSAAARTKVWSAVSSAVGGAAGVAGGAGTASGGAASSAVLAGGTSAAKMLTIGTLLGGVVTVGLASMLLGIGPTPAPPSNPATVAAAAPSPGGEVERSLPEVVPGETSAGPLAATSVPPPPAPGPAPATRSAARLSGAMPAHGAASAPSDDVLLAQETGLVIEARAALARGDAQAALRAVRAARALPSHHLAPEELSVEAQALRAIGREDEARDDDAILKKQFPESALAR